MTTEQEAELVKLLAEATPSRTVHLCHVQYEERRALREALKDTLRRLGEPVALPPAPDHPSCGAWANCDGACADYGHAVQHNAAVLKARAALALAARPVGE